MSRFESVAKPWGTCAGCDSLKAEIQWGHGVELCGRSEVTTAFGRARVSAGLAHAEVCGGRFHPRFPKEQGR